MKYFASLCALVLAGSMPGFAVSANHTSVNPENQFHFKLSKQRAAQLAARDAKFAARITSANQTHELSKAHGVASRTANPTTPFHSVAAQTVRRRSAGSNPPTGKIGFLAATQIPAGGELWYNSLAGDFNGDGKTDLASEVESSGGIYNISIVLSNGDGTFQTPVLTPITNNDPCVALLVGDVNGDGKSDILVGHQPGACGNSYSFPTIDVWLSNGDGTLTLSNNTNSTINTSDLAGGTLADVNGDGKLDIIVVDDNNPANVFTMLGNGDGTFNAPPPPVTLSGQAGNNVVFADLNADGLLDIVDTDYTSGQVTVYLATSAPPYYQSAAPYSSTYNACALTVGDLTGDGKPEIVAANCMDSGNNITVYVNNQDGTFQPGVDYNGAVSGGTNSGPAVLDTNAVTVADVNGDGKADIIATNMDSGDVTILFGNGDGTVNVPTVGYATGGYVWNNYPPLQMPAIVADFNGDGFADIVVPDHLFSFAYLRGYGDGTFRASLDYYAPSSGYSWTYGIATGDFNNDGHPDFVIGNICSCTTPMGITVFLSNPDGSMQPGMNFGTTSNFYYVAVADFNNDKNLDVVAIDNGTGLAQIFSGDGTGNFTPGTPFLTDLTNDSPNGVFVGDFNKDGYPDLAIANPNGGDIAILLNDQTGNFVLQPPISLNGNFVQGAGVADLRGIGKLDLVLPYQNIGKVAVLLGNGDGSFAPEQDYNVGASEPTAVALADLDGDGKLDIAVTLGQGGGQDIAIATGIGDGTFNSFSAPVPSSLQDYTLSAPSPEYIQAADVDGDGKLDLVYSNTNYSTVGVLFGMGNGTFFDPVEYPVGETNWGLVLADVNGDGAPDAVMASYYFAGITALLNNNGAGTLGSYTVGTSAPGATITAGQTATFTLTITPSNHYNGTVTLSCPAGLPALATCSFSPSAVVTLDGLTPQTVTLTITTTAPTASFQIPVGIDPHGNSHPGSSTMLLASLNGMGVFGMFVAGSFNKKRNRWSVLAVLALAMSFFLVGCGGSSSNNNNNGNTTKSNTTSSVASSAATVLVGQAVTFTGTVSAGSGTPTGTVTFLDGTTSLGTGTLSSGKATFQTSSLVAGVHNITIAYGGDSSFNASTSTALSETVDKSGTIASVTSPAATTLVGQAVTFTGTVSANSGTPTGSVTFLDGTTTLGTGTLSSGKATFQTSSLAAGVHNITIAYGGSSNFNASTSTAYSQTVDNPGTSTGSYQVTVSGSGTAGTNGVGSPNQSVNLTLIVQ